MQIPVPKKKTVTSNSIKMLLKNWRNIKKVVAPKRVWMKYLLHLHDNAPAQKARIVTMYLEAKIVIILPYPTPTPSVFSRFSPCDFFLIS